MNITEALLLQHTAMHLTLRQPSTGEENKIKTKEENTNCFTFFFYIYQKKTLNIKQIFVDICSMNSFIAEHK